MHKIVEARTHVALSTLLRCLTTPAVPVPFLAHPHPTPHRVTLPTNCTVRLASALALCAFMAGAFGRVSGTVLGGPRSSVGAPASSSGRCPAPVAGGRGSSRRSAASRAAPLAAAMAAAAPPAEKQQTLRTYRLEDLGPAELKQVLARPRVDFTSILGTVSVSGHATSPTTPWRAGWWWLAATWAGMPSPRRSTARGCVHPSVAGEAAALAAPFPGRPAAAASGVALMCAGRRRAAGRAHR